MRQEEICSCSFRYRECTSARLIISLIFNDSDSSSSIFPSVYLIFSRAGPFEMEVLQTNVPFRGSIARNKRDDLEFGEKGFICTETLLKYFVIMSPARSVVVVE